MKVEYTLTTFTPEYEEYVRRVTNPNGRGNAAYDMDAERRMLPQDRLVKARMWHHGMTGFSAEFLWASGRQDGFVVIDRPELADDEEAVEKRKTFLEGLRNKHQENTHDDRQATRGAA